MYTKESELPTPSHTVFVAGTKYKMNCHKVLFLLFMQEQENEKKEMTQHVLLKVTLPRSTLLWTVFHEF